VIQTDGADRALLCLATHDRTVDDARLAVTRIREGKARAPIGWDLEDGDLGLVGSLIRGRRVRPIFFLFFCTYRKAEGYVRLSADLWGHIFSSFIFWCKRHIFSFFVFLSFFRVFFCFFEWKVTFFSCD
jgi:hypothetical protein